MKIHIFMITLFGLLTSNQSHAAGTAHWGYTGKYGPTHWGELSPEFTTCSSGKNQSPINISELIEGNLPVLKLDYKAGGNEVINNGHTIKINYTPGSMMHAAGKSFELKQLHFHTPSENTINGQSYPMEAHFVHADKDGNLAVIALFYNQGKTDIELEKAWMSMPEKTGKTLQLSDQVNALKLLPTNHDYYRFNGSLTTPPCTEGVEWYAIKQIATVSKEQIDKFSQIMGHPNNRPVQPINARIVIQ